MQPVLRPADGEWAGVAAARRSSPRSRCCPAPLNDERLAAGMNSGAVKESENLWGQTAASGEFPRFNDQRKGARDHIDGRRRYPERPDPQRPEGPRLRVRRGRFTMGSIGRSALLVWKNLESPLQHLGFPGMQEHQYEGIAPLPGHPARQLGVDRQLRPVLLWRLGRHFDVRLVVNDHKRLVIKSLPGAGTAKSISCQCSHVAARFTRLG